MNTLATVALSPEEVATITEARSLGIPIRRVFDEWRTHRPPAIVAKSIGELLPDLISAKRKGGRTERYIVDTESYLGRFCAFVGASTPVDQVDASRIEAWFESGRESPVTRASNLGRIGALFTHARRKGFVRDSPIDRVERIRVVRREPEILRLSYVDRLLRICRNELPDLLNLMVVQLFTGCRPGEAEKLTWSHVQLADRQIVISAEITKVRQRRIAPIHGTGVRWLELTPESERVGRIFPQSYQTLRRRRRQLANLLGVVWRQDITRHTCASALVSTVEDLGKIARWLGNSPRILQTHYLALLDRREAEVILNLEP